MFSDVFWCGLCELQCFQSPLLPLGIFSWTRAQRRSLVEKALEAKGLAAPEAVRWYKKDGRGRERLPMGVFLQGAPPVINGLES